MMLLSTVSFAAPQMVDVVESAKEALNTAGEEAVEAQTALQAETVVPGINLLTGTNAPLDFSSGKVTNDREYANANGNKILTKSANYSNFSVVSSPITGDANNNVLKMTPVAYHQGQSFPEFAPTAALPADGRPVFISFKTALLKGDNISGFAARFGSTTGNSSVGNISLPFYKSADTTIEWKNVFCKDTVSTEKNATTTLWFKDSTAQIIGDATIIPEIYVDDIIYAPYYKVTYKNGNTELGYVYVLDDGNGNILKSINPEAFDDNIAMPEGKNGWALTDGGNKVRSIPLENKDIEVYAVYEPKFKPGINLLTGTEDALDFSDGYGTETSYFGADGTNLLTRINGYIKFSNANSPVVGDTDNKALLLTPIYYMIDGGCYPDFYPNVDLPEDGRPVFVSFRSVVTEGDDINGNVNMNVGSNKKRGSDLLNRTLKPYLSTDTVDAWTKYYVKDNISKTGPAAFSPQFIAKSQATTDESGKVITSAINNATIIPKVYVDDLMYVPYYKVTYMNGNQQIGEPVWVLDDGNGNILDSFAPANQGVEYPEGKNGWALTDGGEKVTSVALDNRDIVLYAVAGAPDSTDELLYAYEFNSEAEVSYCKRNEGSSVVPYYENGSAVFYYDVMNADGNWTVQSQLILLDIRPEFKLSDFSRMTMRIKVSPLNEYKKKNSEGGYDTVPYNRTSTFAPASITAQFYTGNVNGTHTYPFSYNFGSTDDNGGLIADTDGWYVLDAKNMEKSKEAYPANFLLNMKGASQLPFKVEVDYIRMYGDKGAEFSPSLRAPQKREGYSLRVDNPETTGVRFKAAMSDEARANANLTEYGWIVALADTLGTSELTHQFKADNGKTAYVTGKSYCKAENVDKIYETEEGYTIFTAVVTGVPVQYADKYLVVRPYSVVGGAYVYGESRITSPREVGQKIYNKWVEAGADENDINDDYIKYKDYIDTLGITK